MLHRWFLSWPIFDLVCLWGDGTQSVVWTFVVFGGLYILVFSVAGWLRLRSMVQYIA